MNFEYRKGDLILCKKDFVENKRNRLSYKSKESIFFKKNNYYTLDFLNYWDNENTIIVSILNEVVFYVLLTNTYDLILDNAPKFYDYFYSKQELRSIKLKKLKYSE